jgi:hypothetical protein
MYSEANPHYIYIDDQLKYLQKLDQKLENRLKRNENVR